MKNQKNKLAMLLGGTMVASLSVLPISHANENPFEIKLLEKGYAVADASQTKTEDKMKDGNCSAEMMGTDTKNSSGKKEEKSSKTSDKKAKEGSCHAKKK